MMERNNYSEHILQFKWKMSNHAFYLYITAMVPRGKQLAYIVSRGPKPWLFPEQVLFYFNIVPTNAQIISKSCSSKPIRKWVRPNNGQ